MSLARCTLGARAVVDRVSATDVGGGVVDTGIPTSWDYFSKRVPRGDPPIKIILPDPTSWDYFSQRVPQGDSLNKIVS